MPVMSIECGLALTTVPEDSIYRLKVDLAAVADSSGLGRGELEPLQVFAPILVLDAVPHCPLVRQAHCRARVAGIQEVPPAELLARVRPLLRRTPRRPPHDPHFLCLTLPSGQFPCSLCHISTEQLVSIPCDIHHVVFDFVLRRPNRLLLHHPCSQSPAHPSGGWKRTA